MNLRGVSSAGALPERCGGAIPGSDRVISGNLPRLIAAHRDGHHEVLLLSASVFEGVEKGELKRAAPTRSVRSLRPSTQEVAVLPSPTLFWFCERAGTGNGG